MAAKPGDWKCLPFDEMRGLPYHASFSPDQYEKISRGVVPQAMEDKWFIYLDDEVLCFHRSWTGQPVYRIKFQEVDGRHTVTEALCSRAILETSDAHYQSELLDFLIRNLMLGESRPFPKPEGTSEPLPGVYQHAVSGTGYKERIVPRKRWWQFWSK